MLADILIALVILGVLSAIFFLVRSDNRNQKDSNGLNYYNSFTIVCPVCTSKLKFSKDKACNLVVTETVKKLSEIVVKCISCSADLASLYFSHEFVRHALTEAEHLKGSKELSMQFLEELAKLKELTTVIGDSYDEVQTVQTGPKVHGQRNHS